MKKRKPRIAVFASGRGSNFEAILRKVKTGKLEAEIAVVVASNPHAGILEIARKNGIQTCILNGNETDMDIITMLRGFGVEFIVLAGYLRKIGDGLVKAFPQKILNIHPALLPAFGGKGYYGLKVHEAVIESGVKYTGVTVHFVDNEYDHGAIVMQDVVKVKDTDDARTLQKRVLKHEHRIYWKALRKVLRREFKVEGRRIILT
jgi:phosphoribosylglycinamide formyltransferase-1